MAPGESVRGTHSVGHLLSRVDRWASACRLPAIVLFASAVLKAHQLATEPTAEAGILSSRWFLTGLVDYELFLAIWLASGLHAIAAWGTAVLTFAVFSIASLIAILGGAEACGCFGRIKLHPGYSFLLDAALLLVLWRTRPRPGQDAHRGRGRRVVLAGGAFVCLAIPLSTVLTRSPGVKAGGAGWTAGASGLVILEPKEWVGKAFPLIEETDIGVDLRTGEWLVLFHRHDCSKCAVTVPRSIEWARRNYGRPGSPRLALLEVPPFEETGQPLVDPHPAFLSGKLSDHVDWFLRTPALIRISGGLVGSAEDPEALFPKEDNRLGDE
jgi:hypothetical protein